MVSWPHELRNSLIQNFPATLAPAHELGLHKKKDENEQVDNNLMSSFSQLRELQTKEVGWCLSQNCHPGGSLYP